MSGMFSHLTHPDQGPHAAPSSLGPQGHLENFHTFETNLAVPGMGQIPGQWAEGEGMDHAADGGPQATNSTATYYMATDLRDYTPGDLGAEQLLFGRNTDPTVAVSAKVIFRMMPHICLSRLNHYLKYRPAWRRKFGSMEADAFSREWTWKGVMTTKEGSLADPEVSAAEPITWVQKGRVTIPNVFLSMCSGSMGEGDQAYLLPQKFIWNGDAIDDDKTWRKAPAAPGAAAIPAGPPAAARVPLGASPMHHCMAQLAAAHTAAPQRVLDSEWNNAQLAVGDPSEKDAECYWQYLPYVAKAGQPPGPEMYRNGYRIHIGVASHVMRGPNDATPQMREWAQNATFPRESGKKFMDEGLAKIDRVELILRGLQPGS